MNLDGSHDEGGGQIVRNGASYSALLQLPLTIRNIRQKRPKPGLKNQHLAGIRLVNEITNGKIKGDELHSLQVMLWPSGLQPTGSSFVADSTTAGAITLLMQVSFPVLLFCPPPSSPSSTISTQESPKQTVVLKGGTNVSFSPPIDYIIHVFNPLFTRVFCGGYQRCQIQIDRRGFMAKGGGQVTMTVNSLGSEEHILPATLLERGRVTRISGSIYTAGTLDHSVAIRLKKYVIAFLRKSEYGSIPNLAQDIAVVHEEGPHGGASGINLWAETSTGCVFGGGIIGRPRKASEEDAREACEELLRNLRHGGCVDEYFQDMMVIFMALAKGRSQVVTGPLTQHTTTAFHVAKEMTGVEFSCTRLETLAEMEAGSVAQERYLIECEGIGLSVK
ncbi:hypothetical protein BG006_006035 [Podila minutissima]|uniref:RNA 3'-terminal-phosphate cyclase (ATP) n=1 Tax=Podila minutissima TaxID=64525 RepID=A0A9P5SS65_9FUNG|nr:hypothetical protein BG006_006035 [Podila minutissima]